MATHTNQKLPEPRVFAWEGTNKNGVKIKGESPALNANLLRANLRRQGINPLRIYKKPVPLIPPSIKSLHITQFARQMTTMMSSGVPMVQALEMVGNSGDNVAMSNLIKNIKRDVEGGSSFGVALSHHPKYFDSLFVNLVKAGEQAGTLETMLNKVALYKEKTESTKAKVKKALMYPIIVIIAAIIVTAIMLIFVIPQFKDIFAGFGAELPAFTLWVIGLSEWLQANWYFPLGGLIIFVYGFLEMKRRSPAFSDKIDHLFLKFPIVGNILNLSAIARYCRTSSTMFAAGVPVVEAMDAVSGATGNALYRDATLRIKDDTSKGVQLNTAMQTAQVFPSLVLQMTKIGEESGRLEEMLGKAADYYEEQVDNLVDSLAKQIEPLIMAVLGVLVGGLIIAMYLPIFQLGSVI
ncbi:type II secretion system F family protein [Thiofilum flexile]|uniref:type II secretion system F family protein n=1 Tax=Thiofilum flexile TaxID=125627 RepID=UPI00038273B3|nr:type II secretion system F family protein [Thiofilum flexile]